MASLLGALSPCLAAVASPFGAALETRSSVSIPDMFLMVVGTSQVHVLEGTEEIPWCLVYLGTRVRLLLQVACLRPVLPIQVSSPSAQPLPIRTPQQHRSSRGSLPSATAPAGGGGVGAALSWLSSSQDPVREQRSNC